MTRLRTRWTKTLMSAIAFDLGPIDLELGWEDVLADLRGPNWEPSRNRWVNTGRKS